MAYSNITITTNTNLSFVTGEFVQLIHDANNYMFAQVVDYDFATGVMTVTPISFVGDGAFDTWTVIASAAPGSSGTSGNSTSGNSGTAGTSGATGSSGTSGANGTNGSSGTAGILQE
jgi:hypothetical protein